MTNFFVLRGCFAARGTLRGCAGVCIQGEPLLKLPQEDLHTHPLLPVCHGQDSKHIKHQSSVISATVCTDLLLQVQYCAEVCREESWSKFHSVECGILAYLEPSRCLGRLPHLALR